MNKTDLFKKLEDAINSFKQEVEKNDGSTLSTIGNTISSGIDSLVGAISSNSKAQKVVDKFNKHMNELEEAIIKGDKKISATAISAIQKGMQELKKKFTDEALQYQATGKPGTIKYTPNKSKIFTVGKDQDVPVAKPVKKAAAKPKAATAKKTSAPKDTTSKAPATTKKAAASSEKKTPAAKSKTVEAKPKSSTAAKAKSKE